MTLSDHSTTALEDVIAQGQGNLYMMHICFYKDRSKTLRVIKRAEGPPTHPREQHSQYS